VHAKNTSGEDKMSLPALQKVKVLRFKRISEAMVELSDINLFVGPNNSGKTSFIQGLHFAISLLQTITFQNKWTVASRSAAVSFGPSELIYVPTESIYSVSHGSALTQDRAISFHFDLVDENDFGVSVYKERIKIYRFRFIRLKMPNDYHRLLFHILFFAPASREFQKMKTWCRRVSCGVLWPGETQTLF
jgi:predicted ATP-dependent endonuclease of OLD family